MCAVSWPYVIYFPTPMVPIRAENAVKHQANKQINKLGMQDMAAVLFSFKTYFSFGDILVLVLTFLYVNVVRLMTTLSK